MALSKLKILSIDRVVQSFGVTDYAMYKCETPSQKHIIVGLSHNMLTSCGIGTALYDDLVGCLLIVKDDVEISTGVLRKDAEKRVSDVENKLPKNSVLLVNSSNAELVKSDVLRNEILSYSVKVDSLVKVEKDNARRLERARRNLQNVEQAIATAQQTAPAVEVAPAEDNLFSEADKAQSEEYSKQIEASLEQNDEAPF